MNIQLAELQQIVRDRNEITMVALECAALVLDKAFELPPEHRERMIALLRNLISSGGQSSLGNA